MNSKMTSKTARQSAALLALTAAIALGGSAFAEVRTLKVSLTNTAGKPVPVSFSLVQVRDAVGAEFATQFTSLKVLSASTEVPYQIDDVDGNGRVSAGDEMSFLASGPVTISASDVAGTAASYPARLTATAGADGATMIASSTTPGFTVEVSKAGLTRITGFGATKAVLADEIGNARVEGYNASTFYKDKTLGAYLEGKTTLTGMTLVSSKVLPAGPARVTVVSRYASPDFVGLEQTVVSRVYASGDVDVSSTFNFRGYTDIMKLEHQATRIVTEADPDAVHLSPVFRRVGYADLLKQTPSAFYGAADRKATLSVGGKTYIAFPAGANLKNPFWGGSYLFASPEPWRSNFSSKLKQGVAEIAYGTPALAKDYNTFVAGDQWQLESGEFRTGVFKWLPAELKPADAASQLFTNPDPWVQHYYPGDTVSWRYVYDAYAAATPAAAVTYLEKRHADLSSITLSK